MSAGTAPTDKPLVAEEETDNTGSSASIERRLAELEARINATAEDGWKISKFPPLEIKSADGDFKLKVGGRIQLDATFTDSEGAFDQIDGIEFRRARLFLEGLMYGNIAFKAQYDMANGPIFNDVWMEVLDLLPFGGLRLGHFKEPFSLEEQTSSKYITFLERSLLNTFSPARNTGAMVHGDYGDERGTFAAGIFQPSDDFGTGVGAGEWSGTGRLTFLPVEDADARRVVHLGAAYSRQSADGGMIRYRSRPEAHLLNRPIDTGSIAADDADLIDVEAAWVEGPFSLQGEYLMASVNAQPTDTDRDYGAFYVEGSYFVTGESRAYKKSAGAFDRVKPKRNWKQDGGLGAVQIAARYSHLDLDDGPTAQTMDDVTVGINWHLNPHTRFMINAINSNYQDDNANVDDMANILLLRWQIDF